MKLAVIGGAGGLGATTAFCCGYKHLVDEIKLIDIKENMVKSHAMDMGQAFLPFGKTKVSAADYPDISDCEIILCCASMPEGKVKDRADILGANIKIMLPICENIKKYGNPNAAVIITGAPIDVWAYCFWKLIGWKPSQFLGFSVNDAFVSSGRSRKLPARSMRSWMQQFSASMAETDRSECMTRSSMTESLSYSPMKSLKQ